MTERQPRQLGFGDVNYGKPVGVLRCLERCGREECSCLDSFYARCPLYPVLNAPAWQVQNLLFVLLERDRKKKDARQINGEK